MRTPVIAATVLAATCALPAAAYAHNAAHAENAAHVEHTAHTRSTLSDKDRAFLDDAGHGAQFEIAGGTVAAAHATDARVRAFGARMVRDHGREAAALGALAAQLGVSVPDAPDRDQAAVVHIWSTLSGSALDCSYAPAEYVDHVGDVASYEDEAEYGDDARVRAFAAAQLPVLHHHLRLAKRNVHHLSCG